MNPPMSTHDWQFWAFVAAILVIVPVLGYWFLSVWLKLREALTATLRKFMEEMKAGRVRRSQSASALRQDLMERTRVVEIDREAAGAWNHTIETMLEGVRAGGAQIEKARIAATKATKPIERIAQRIKNLKIASTTVPKVPPLPETLIDSRTNRKARGSLILAILFLIPIMFANAQLTGLVLREIIPPVQPLFGLPVAYMLALILVIVEAVIGLLHSHEAEQSQQSERKLTIAAIVWNLAAVGVVAIESILYSQVQPESGALKLPIGGSAFALVGAILGLAVFGLGRLAHSSWMAVINDRTPKVLAKQLDRLRNSAEEWNLIADKLKPRQKAATEQFEHLAELCKNTSDAQGHAIQRFERELGGLRESPPAWALAVERPITQSEFNERESRSFLWLTVAAISTISLIVLSAQLVSHLSVFAGAALGLGSAVAAFAAGALGSQSTPHRGKWRFAWYLVLLTLVIVFTIVSDRYLRGSVGIYSPLTLIPALAAFVSGVQTGPFLTLLRLPFLWLANRLIDAILFFCLAILWFLNLVAAIIEHLARFIAWPVLAIVTMARARRQRERDATIA
jgi:hypothetical protein